MTWRAWLDVPALASSFLALASLALASLALASLALASLALASLALASLALASLALASLALAPPLESRLEADGLWGESMGAAVVGQMTSAAAWKESAPSGERGRSEVVSAVS
jgi:hypothetical protein